MKATQQYFPLVVFIMLCKVVLTFESVDEIFVTMHSIEISLNAAPYFSIIAKFPA